MKVQFFISILIFLLSWNGYSQKTIKLAGKSPYAKYKISKNSLTDDGARPIILQEESPIKLDKIELIANSTGTLPTPQFIYKGEVNDEAAPLLVDPSGFTALINGGNFSSISSDDGGQLYISQAWDNNLFRMLRDIDQIENTIYEIRFGEDGEGLALEYSYIKGIFKVPFTVWDLNGNLDNADDDIQMIPRVYTWDGDTTWGIRTGFPSPWEQNPAQQSDVIYVYYAKSSYEDFEAAYQEQVMNQEVDLTVSNKHLRQMILLRITINSLDENPLSTINSRNSLPRPKPGTIIRWSFQITPYAPRVTDKTTLWGAIGEELVYWLGINGYPRPAYSLILPHPNMTIDESTGVINWIPVSGFEGLQHVTVSASNYLGSIEEQWEMWIDAYPWEGKDHDNNNIICTVFNTSNIGDQQNAMIRGKGFNYKDNNALYGCQLIVAQSDSQISGELYADEANNDFATLSKVQSATSQIINFDQAFTAEYGDQRADRPLGVKITQNSYSKSTVPDDDYIILDYQIQNTKSELLDGIYVSLFLDLDVGDPYANLGGYDASRKLSYIWEAGNITNPYYYGYTLLKGEVSGHTIEASYNDNILLFQQMQEIATVPADTGEYRSLLATGPYTIPPEQTIRVVYALLGGDNLADIQANADAAHAVNLNRIPVVATTIANQTLAVGGYNYILDLKAEPPIFEDPDKDNLTYSAESSSSTVATVNISDNILTVTPQNQGNATITITADDGHEGIVNTSFTVSVVAAPTLATGSASDVTPVSVVMNGSINPNGRTTEVFFEFGTSTSYGDTAWADQNPVSGTGIQAVAAHVVDLDFGTTYYYRLVAKNELIKISGNDQIFTTGIYPANITINKTINFPSYTNPEDYSTSDYQIVGIPGKTSEITIENLLSGKQGEDWQVYWDNGADADYFVKYDGSAQFKLEAGRAFWLVNMGPLGIGLTVQTAPLNSMDQVEIDVHTGWNIITNPFDAALEWSTIQAANGISRPIFSYEGLSGWQQQQSFEPYTGYYLFNDANLSKLKIPYKAIFYKTAVSQQISWQVRISLFCDSIKDALTCFGVSKQANKDLDELDFRKPRATGPIPGVYFLRQEWDARYSTFARDIRPPIQDIEVWEFDVYSAATDAIRLTFDGVDQIPSNLNVFLLDCDHLRYSDLRKNTDYAYKPTRDVSKLKILVGLEENVKEEINKYVPTEFALGNNFPNPFNPTTSIPVTIPFKSTVTLKVYNMLGQEIATLFDGILDTGRHYFTWGGTNDSGTELSSGVYIYHFTTQNGLSFAGKMVYIK